MKTKRVSISMIAMILVAAFIFPAQVNAQGRKDQKRDREEMVKRVNSAKIAFITENLDLSPEEAQVFWPVYNEMNKKRDELILETFGPFKRENEQEEPTEAEAKEMMAKRLDNEEALLKLKREYHEEFLNILPATKVMKLYEVEHRFRGHLIDNFKPDRGERKQDNRMGEAPPCRENNRRFR